MTIKMTYLCAAAAATMAWPGLAAAQMGGEAASGSIYTSSVELGAGWISTDSFKFGEYSGHEDRGLFGIGNLDVLRRPGWDSGDPEYWRIVGSNLGLESRAARVEYGQQGRFKLFADYDQLPHYITDDAKTPFIGAGSSNLTLPGNWVPSGTTAGMTALMSSLQPVEIETERMKFGGGFSWVLGNMWQLDGQYHREHKDGIDTIAGIFAVSGGNPRGAILPMPIDQNTDQLELALKYNGKKMQAQLAYSMSLFNNDLDSLTWRNPFTANGAWDPSQGFATGGQGRLALDPDNQAHQVTLSSSFTVDPTTLISGSLSYGQMTQDADFLPLTINPSLLTPVPLPRNSLEGKVETIHANLTATARPLPKADVKASYTFDDRDNTTPRDVFLVVRNDSEQQAALVSDRARVNRPYSRRSHKVEVDGGYQVLPRTKLSAGYEFEQLSRTFEELDSTSEHTGRVKLRSSPFSFASGWVEYAHSMRHGSQYTSNQPFLDGHTEPYIATLTPTTGLFENDPLLRKYYMADRDQDKVVASVTVNPHDQVTVGLRGSFTRQMFDETVVGLTERRNMSFTVDSAFMPTSAVTLTAFGTLDRGRHSQNGYQRSVQLSPDSERATGTEWTVVTLDRAVTAGVGAEWAAIPNLLDLSADYTFSRAFTEFDIDGGTALVEASLPALRTTLHSLALRGDIRVRQNVLVRLGYALEWFNTRDFAQDGVEANTLANVINMADSSPDYIAHVFGISAVFEFYPAKKK